MPVDGEFLLLSSGPSHEYGVSGGLAKGDLGWLSPRFQGRLGVVGLGRLWLGQLEIWALFHESHLPAGWPGCVLVEKAEGQEEKRRHISTFQASACLVFANILVTNASHTEPRGRHHKVTETRA